MPAPRVPLPPVDRRTARRILDRLKAQHPNAFTELNFTTPFELLVATILSAQSTDRRVNEVTPALFGRFPTAAALAEASPADVEAIIKPTGFFRAKTRSIIGMAATLVERHDGEVPGTLDALVALPGVGRKTANVVLGHAFGVAGLPVDRHVLRVSQRLGLADAKIPEHVEQQLAALFPKRDWTLVSDTLILHGRRVCRPRPLCDACAARLLCAYAQRGGSAARGPRSATTRRRPSARRPGRAR